jgi:hypothetical protein
LADSHLLFDQLCATSWLAMERTRSTIQWSKWFSAFVCLLTYLTGASGMLPEFCALAAKLDGSHTPLIGAQVSQTVLVLSHSKNGVPMSNQVSQQHGLIARCLCVLANQNSTQRDHRLEFASCGVSVNTQNEIKFGIPTSELPSAFDGSLCRSIVVGVAAIFGSERGIIQPPASLLSTRTTVLLV